MTLSKQRPSEPIQGRVEGKVIAPSAQLVETGIRAAFSRSTANQLGADFVLEEFMDAFDAAGTIPVSLIRWEMTGLTDEMEKLW